MAHNEYPSEIPQYYFSEDIEVPVATVYLPQESDLYSEPAVRPVVLGHIANDEIERLVLDFEHVEYIDSTFLGMFVGAAKRVRAAQRRTIKELILQGPAANKSIPKIFEVTGLDRVFKMEGFKGRV
ncbi:MAG TPA: STAS domain-containing protein [Candidatus Saccharimonadales bacterium]|nr:STAS domain-containing protein [Candidatus Saccharimonadales bacterium]